MKSILFDLAILGLIFHSAVARAGSGTPNGGDPYEIEFKSMANKSVEIIYSASYGPLPEALRRLDNVRLRNTIRIVTVEFTDDKLFVRKGWFGKVEKAALNYPDRNLIRVNRGKWVQVRAEVTLAFPLVLHEYMGIAGDERGNYEISDVFRDYIRKACVGTTCASGISPGECISSFRKYFQFLVGLLQKNHVPLPSGLTAEDFLREMSSYRVLPKYDPINECGYVANPGMVACSHPDVRSVELFCGNDGENWPSIKDFYKKAEITLTQAYSWFPVTQNQATGLALETAEKLREMDFDRRTPKPGLYFGGPYVLLISKSSSLRAVHVQAIIDPSYLNARLNGKLILPPDGSFFVYQCADDPLAVCQFLKVRHESYGEFKEEGILRVGSDNGAISFEVLVDGKRPEWWMISAGNYLEGPRSWIGTHFEPAPFEYEVISRNPTLSQPANCDEAEKQVRAQLRNACGTFFADCTAIQLKYQKSSEGVVCSVKGQLQGEEGIDLRGPYSAQ